MEIYKAKFVEWMEVKGLSKRSIKMYCFYFNKFDLSQLSQEYCISFLRKNRGLTIPRAFLKNLFEYILQMEIPEEYKDVVRRIQIPRSRPHKPKKDIKILSLSEVYRVVEAMPHLKGKLMVLITFYGGLRASELVGDGESLEGLKTDSFNWGWWEQEENKDKFCPVMVKGKGRKRRLVFIPPNIAETLYNWINKVFSLENLREDKLFGMGIRCWEILLDKAGRKALGRGINPHLLRHSCANYLRSKGADLEVIRKYLGHQSIKTTQIYLHLTDPELEEGITKAFS